MPLRDHFASPWQDENPWEGFHSAWANTIVRYLNGSVLSRRYKAVPQVHLGAWVEADVATLEKLGGRPDIQGEGEEAAGGTSTAVWSPPQPAQTLTVEFPDPDEFEVRVLDQRRNMRLVAAIELISPGNKDRAEQRTAFTAKCAAYLKQQVGLVVVDVITHRHANLHQELLQLLAQGQQAGNFPPLYAVAYRTHRDNGRWRLDDWPMPLVIGQALPTMPLWLANEGAVPLDLEKTYEETCQVLRIE
jgi:hypothetical protein